MIRRIQTLEQKNAALEDSVKEKDTWIGSVVEALKSDRDGFGIINGLKDGISYEQLSQSLGRPAFGEDAQYSPSRERHLSEIVRRYELRQSPEASSTTSETQLSRASTDQQLQYHLIMLYFIWVHPVHMLFLEERFVDDYETGGQTYCSPSLISSICAMGSLYSSEEDVGMDVLKLTRHLLRRAHQQLTQEDNSKLPSVTAYAVSFLVELSLCQARNAASHLGQDRIRAWSGGDKPLWDTEFKLVSS